ncbi:hypothetical protein [uncultured Roseobacter sp.]|uniref:hypothetical protein n=1 Tax=uncultured Roseobacter sp. TaxID=114847 RepID=UPI002631874F|nr:hypothetical protein [uncultured Roseobacter sp.]
MTEKTMEKKPPEAASEDSKTVQAVPPQSESKAETMLSLPDMLGLEAPQSHEPILSGHPDAQTKARLLYNYCIASERKVTESVHILYTIAEHYAGDNPNELDSPEVINGIPRFFNSLTAREKSEFCYNQVTEALSREALPVTVNSLLATRRTDPNDRTSSAAGRFVQRVTRYVSYTLLILLLLFAVYSLWNSLVPQEWQVGKDTDFIQWASWIAFGCVGALVHLLNHALTATRMKTFELSEERKVWPRLLLGGMFGFVVPWILMTSSALDLEAGLAVGSVAAFFGGYSVRFSIALLERLLQALLPETKPNG